MKRIEFKSGASRFVICVGKYAFKFPLAYPGQRFTRRLCNGILGNLTEKEFSSFEFKFSDFTLTCCPVVFSLPFGLLNVMYRVDPIGEEERFFWDIKWSSCRSRFCLNNLTNKYLCS